MKMGRDKPLHHHEVFRIPATEEPEMISVVDMYCVEGKAEATISTILGLLI